MTTQEIAKKLVDYCREGNFQACYDELYDPKVVSIEPKEAMNPRVEGLEGIYEKGKNWNASVEEVHSSSISDPLCASNYFTCVMSNDITFKQFGRQQIEEICLYEIQNGKIVREEFFYHVENPNG
jgi:hypothetical protein